MGTLRRAMVGIAVTATALTGAAACSDATTNRVAPSAVRSKAEKPKKQAASACKLLTIAEITQALGTAPTEPPRNSSASDCYYTAATYPNFFNLSIRPLVSPALWNQAAQGGGASIPVSGIGDQAYRSPNNATIMVRKGTQTLRIDQFVAGLDETRIEGLAKAAIGRL